MVFFCFKISENSKTKKNDIPNYENNRIIEDAISNYLNPNKNTDENNTDKGKKDKDLNENLEFKAFRGFLLKFFKPLNFLVRKP